MLLLIANGLREPLVPFRGQSVLQNSIGDGIMPPNPVRVKLFHPRTERFLESMGMAGGVREEFVEHDLPKCDGSRRRGLSSRPSLGVEDFGPLFAFPNPRINMCSCSVAEFRGKSDLQVESDFVDAATGR